ncbi:hypothetical protein CDAR_495561 [Caerostris darwini]|uniref:Uncharacterized protein n=1 Tax=Caerostris darwini TaxID=1538125 RepID=A0AAV4SC52_9ARAC|nr:hypothetical protein CDAR_495561 [Caerostris darwini]
MREVHSAEYPGVTHFRGTSLKSSLKYGQLKSIYFLTRDFGKGIIHPLKNAVSRPFGLHHSVKEDVDTGGKAKLKAKSEDSACNF